MLISMLVPFKCHTRLEGLTLNGPARKTFLQSQVFVQKQVVSSSSDRLPKLLAFLTLFNIGIHEQKYDLHQVHVLVLECMQAQPSTSTL